MAPVAILTDFGTRDGYVGEMKGVLLSAEPDLPLVDVTHVIPRGDIRAGAWSLGRVWSRFPPSTVHLAVVDPGVGSDRRAVAVRAAERWFVGPDNGLLSWVLQDVPPRQCVEIVPDRVGTGRTSDTFHGRDVFAPAAAVLATGGTPADLGPPVDPGSLVRLDLPRPERFGSEIRGAVWHVDRFGNLVTNVPASWLPETPVAEVADREIRGLSSAYRQVETGELLLTRGSVGTLEISARDTSAARSLGVDVGEKMTVRPAED